MALGNVSEELAKLKKEQSDTTSAVNDVAGLLLQQINMGKRSRLDELEAMREAKKATSSTGKKVESGTKKSGMLGLGFLGLPGMALPALAAVVASITGFDDAIKATLMATNLDKLGKGLSTIGKSIKSTLKAIDTFVLDIRTFPFARYIPKIKVDVPENYKIKLPDLPKISFVDSLGKSMSALKARMAFKLKLPDLPKFTFFSGGVAATAEKLADFGKINLDALKSKLPKFSIEIPEGLQNGLDKIGNAFGKWLPGGGGLAGFLNGFETMLGTITKPLKAASKFLLAPLAPFLTLIDFVVGFYKGFTEEKTVTDRFGRTKVIEQTLGEKLMSGLEGGLLGIVTGITEAFDLLFVTVPAWLLDKFGFEKAAEFLRGFSLTDMVDPIWNGIKDMFKRYFGPKEDGTSRMAHIFNEFWNDLTSIFRKLFDFIPTFEELKKGFYDIMPNWLKKVFVDNDDGGRAENDRGYVPENVQQSREALEAKRTVLTQQEMNALYRALALQASGIEQKMVDGQMVNTREGQVMLDSYNARGGDKRRERFAPRVMSSGTRQLEELKAQLIADGKEAQLKEFYRLNQGMRGAQGNVLIEAPATSSSVDNSSTTYNAPAPINTPRTHIPGT